LYSQQSASGAVLFDVDKIYYNNSQLTIEEFKSKLSFEVYYFYTSRRTCIFSYTTIDDFSILSTVAQRYIQIYKDLITKLWSLEQFTGYDAKYIDLFSMSSLETITPISWDLSSS
jgi:hypothetical protein